jgi:hypothetical protein
MINQTFNNLDMCTKNFLQAIDEASELYSIDVVSRSEETLVRALLRDAFEDYFEVLMKTEDRYGIESTQHSQEMIQNAISEFLDEQSETGRQSIIAEDLDAYSAIVTQTMLCATAVVQ